MSVSKVASRYAKSLIDLANEQGKLERVLEDMEGLQRAVKQSPELKIFLKSPVIQSAKKIAVYKQIFESRFDELTYKFFELLTKKQRENLLAPIATEYVKQYKQIKGISTARIISATELSEASLKAIREKVEKSGVVHKEVELEVKIDPKLIGGFVLEFGDYVYDASVIAQLADLKKQFRKNLYESKIMAR